MSGSNHKNLCFSCVQEFASTFRSKDDKTIIRISFLSCDLVLEIGHLDVITRSGEITST